MATVLDLIWVGWQQLFFGKSEIKDSTPNGPTGKSRRLQPGWSQRVGAKRRPMTGSAQSGAGGA